MEIDEEIPDLVTRISWRQWSSTAQVGPWRRGSLSLRLPERHHGACWYPQHKSSSKSISRAIYKSTTKRISSKNLMIFKSAELHNGSLRGPTEILRTGSTEHNGPQRSGGEVGRQWWRGLRSPHMEDHNTEENTDMTMKTLMKTLMLTIIDEKPRWKTSTWTTLQGWKKERSVYQHWHFLFSMRIMIFTVILVEVILKCIKVCNLFDTR